MRFRYLKRLFIYFATLTLVLLAFEGKSLAQLDANYDYLFQNNENKNQKNSPSRSSRYKIKKKSTSELKSKNETARNPAQSSIEVQFKTPEIQNQESQKQVGVGPIGEINSEVKKSPAIADKIGEVLLGAKMDSIPEYKERVHDDDNRQNVLEIEVKPGMLLNQSTSNFSYRSYKTSSPSLDLSAKIWLTPFFGLYGSYGTSLLADVDAGLNDKIPTKHESVVSGLSFRRYSSLSRRAILLETDVEYVDYKFQVPADDINRARLTSGYLNFKIQTRLPWTPAYAWYLGLSFAPILNHQEKETGIQLRSGESVASNRIGLSVGGELKFSRRDQIIWGLSSEVEKNQFSGSALNDDPETGLKPNGVSVTNIFTQFSFGYRWGH